MDHIKVLQPLFARFTTMSLQALSVAMRRYCQNDGLKNSTYRTRAGRQVGSQHRNGYCRELWARLQLKYIYAWQAGVSGSSNTPLVSRRSSRRRTGSTRLNARHEAVRRTRQCACAPRSAPRVQVPASDSNQSHTLQYGESENTGKLTGSRMALIERGLDAKPVSSKSQNHMQRHTVQAAA